MIHKVIPIKDKPDYKLKILSFSSEMTQTGFLELHISIYEDSQRARKTSEEGSKLLIDILCTNYRVSSICGGNIYTAFYFLHQYPDS